jgi:plasmid stabilization system protein ParE
MAFAITIMPRAQLQIAAAAAWWREHRPAAPRLLEEELDRALSRLAANPRLGTLSPWPRLPDVRRIVARRVGYMIVYRPRLRLKRIEVLAVWHTRRGGPPR